MSNQLALDLSADDTGIRHAMMPDLATACRVPLLEKDAGDKVTFAWSSPGAWSSVTCPWCRCQGRECLSVICRQMQGRQAA